MKSLTIIINEYIKRVLLLLLRSYIHLLQKLEGFIGISITEKNRISTHKLIKWQFFGSVWDKGQKRKLYSIKVDCEMKSCIRVETQLSHSYLL